MDNKKDQHQKGVIHQMIINGLNVKSKFNCFTTIIIYFQILQFFQPYYILFNSKTYNFQDNLSFQSFQLIIRADIFLIDRYSLPDIYIIILAFIVLEFFSVFCFRVLLQKAEKTTQIRYQAITKWVTNFDAVFSFYQQMLPKSLYLPLTTLCLHNFINHYSRSPSISEGIHLLFISVTFILLQIQTIFYLYIFSPSLTFKVKNHETTQTTKFMIVIYFMNLISQIFYVTNHNYKYYQQLQLFMLAIISLLQILNQILCQIYIYPITKILLFVINSYILTYSMTYFLLFNKDSIANSNKIIYITLTPLITILLLKYDHHKSISNFLACRQLHPQQKWNIISALIEQLNDINSNHSLIAVKTAIIGSYHSKICNTVSCNFCSSKKIIENFQSTPITKDIYEQFLYNVMLKLLENNFQVSARSNANRNISSSLYEYAFLLFDLKWSNQALQALNMFLDLTPQQDEYNSVNYVQYRSLSEKQDQLTQLTSQRFLTRNTQIESQIRNQYKGKKISIDIVTYCKSIYVRQQTIQLLLRGFGTSLHSDVQSEISHFFTVYFHYETSLQKIAIRLNNLLRLKLDIYHQISQAEKIISIKQKIINFAINYSKIEKFLERSSLFGHSLKNNLAQAFFYAFIANNNYLAIKIIKQRKSKDEIININWKKMQLIPDISQTAFTFLQIENDVKNIRIKSVSSFLKKYYEIEANVQLKFENFVPLFLLHPHEEVVEQFMNNGVSKFYKNFSQSFILSKDNILDQTQTAFEEVKTSNDLQFLMIFQISYPSKSWILVDSQTALFNVSKEFLMMVGLQKEKIGIVGKLLKQIKISFLFPEFLSYLLKLENEIKIENTYFCFPVSLLSSKAHIFHFFEEHMSNSKMKLEMKTFPCNLLLTKHFFGSYCYYKIIVENQYGQQYFVETQKTIVQIPCQATIEETYQKQMTTNFNDLQWRQQNECSISESQNSVKYSGLKAFFGVASKDIFSSSNIAKKYNDQSASPDQIIIQSPNLSQNYKATETQLLNQESSRLAQQALNVKQITQHDLSGQPQAKSDNENCNPVLQREHNQDLESSIFRPESFKFARAQLLFILNKIKEAKYSPKLLNQIIVFFIGMNLLQFIFSFLMYYLIRQQFSQLKQNSDDFQLSSTIIYPLDNQLLTTLSLISVKQLFIQQQITQEILDIQQQILVSQLIDSYQELKLTYEDLQQNNNMDSFYQYTYINLSQIIDLDSTHLKEVQKLDFRELLNYILSRTYELMMNNLKSDDAYQQQFPDVLIANYISIQQYFRDTNQCLDDCYQAESDNNQIICNSLFYTYLTLILIIGIILIRYTSIYYHQFHKIFKIINLIHPNSINYEISKLKKVINLSKNNDYVFESCTDLIYFELSTKQEDVISLSPGLQEKHKKASKQVSNITLWKAKLILQTLMFVIILLIYSICDTLVKVNYIQQYYSALKLSRIYGDLKIRGGNVYIYKEILMMYDNLSYMMPEEKFKLVEFINDSTSGINEYLSFSGMDTINNFIGLDSQYVQFYLNTLSNNLCDQLNNTFSMLQNACYQSFEGIMQKGLISTLIYITNDIVNQQDTFSISNKIVLQDNEMEGALVVMKILNSLNQYYLDGLNQQAKSYLSFYTIYFAVGIAILTIVTLISIIPIYESEVTDYHNVIKFIHFIPGYQLFYDKKVERKIKQLLD